MNETIENQATGGSCAPPTCWHWIKSAITAGGVMTMSSPMPGKTYFQATMNWKGEDPVSGKMHMDPLDAMTSLNQALMEDAADEMVANGNV